MHVLVQAIFICIIATLSATTVAAPTINLQADKTSYTVGNTVILVITLSDSPLIYGGGLDLTFNPAVVNAISVQVNPSWDFTIKEGIIDNAAGDISDIFFTHFSGLTGNLPVATITLNTIAAGSAGLSIAVSAVKQFTDTGGEIVTFGISNLANNILVNAAPEEDPEESKEEDTTDQADTDQTTDEETATEKSTTTENTDDQPEAQQTTTDSGIFMPANKPSDRKKRSDTVDSDGQNNSSTVINQRNSGALTTNTQQGFATTDPYNNRTSPSTSRLGIDSEHSEDDPAERPFDPATQTALSSENNSVTNAGKKNPDDIPTLLITLIFIILAFMVYKIIAYNKNPRS